MENKKLWFRAKRFGWGWTPITWQGWLITLFYIMAITYPALKIDKQAHSGSDALIGFAPYFIFFTTILLIICYKKGERPHWSWGKR